MPLNARGIPGYTKLCNLVSWRLLLVPTYSMVTGQLWRAWRSGYGGHGPPSGSYVGSVANRLPWLFWVFPLAMADPFAIFQYILHDAVERNLRLSAFKCPNTVLDLAVTGRNRGCSWSCRGGEATGQCCWMGPPMSCPVEWPRVNVVTWWGLGHDLNSPVHIFAWVSSSLAITIISGSLVSTVCRQPFFSSCGWCAKVAIVT